VDISMAELVEKRTPNITIPEDEVRAYCQRNHIKSLALFGSVLRENFMPDSDVDVLIEFEPGYVPGYRFFAMQDELSTLFGRKVDLNTRGFLSPHFRDSVEFDALIVYAKA
jgi:predicted nucleotidyltransferase